MIGRYVVTFSQLIYEMRSLAGRALTRDQALGDLALGQAPAQQITDSFFGMCRYRGRLDSAETNVANQLQTEISKKKIPERNKIAHGDWWVGGALGGSREVLERARLIRTYPSNREGRFERQDEYTIAELDSISDRLIELRLLVSLFGKCALNLWGTDYRVSDVLVARDVPKNGKGGTVEASGPRASELYLGPLL